MYVQVYRSTAKDLSMPGSKVVPEDQKPRPRRRPRFPFCCGDAADDLHGTGSAADLVPRGAWRKAAGGTAADEQTWVALGCDNAGKTTLVLAILGRNEESAPTVGFEPHTVKLDGTPVRLFDWAVARRFADLEQLLCADVHGAVFVVDAADAGRLDEGAEATARGTGAREAARQAVARRGEQAGPATVGGAGGDRRGSRTC